MHSLEIKTVKFAQLEMRLDSQILTHFALSDKGKSNETKLSALLLLRVLCSKYADRTIRHRFEKHI
mgnify:CR=1 FL=1